jgi:hypothetical protein
LTFYNSEEDRDIFLKVNNLGETFKELSPTLPLIIKVIHEVYEKNKNKGKTPYHVFLVENLTCIFKSRHDIHVLLSSDRDRGETVLFHFINYLIAYNIE